LAKIAKFPVKYIYQENNGKHSAINKGVVAATGEIFVILDSDDWLHHDATHHIYEEWSLLGEEFECYSMITFLYASSFGNVIGDKFPDDRFDSNSVEIRTKYGVKGDKFGSIRKSALLRHKFPEDLGKFVPQSLIWVRLSRCHKVRYVNRIIAYTEYQPDGLTANKNKLLYGSPLSSALRYEELISNSDYFNLPYKKIFSAYVKFQKFTFHSGSFRPYKRKMPHKVIGLIAWPLALIIWKIEVYKL